MWRAKLSLWACVVAGLFVVLSSLVGVLAQDGGGTRATEASVAVRQLTDRQPYVRQRAAEKLAQLAATDERRLVEGYRMQEKDARVKLALDWALYRMGKGEALFNVVRGLDSSRSEQALAYLKELEGPEPLYVFLKHVNGNTQIRLLEVLAHIGDRETLARIKPFTESLDPGIADAAKFAEREITIRLEETPAVEPKRQRQVGTKNEAEP